MSDPLLATGQCRTELHPLCPGGLCTCGCHQPAQPAAAGLEGAAGTPGDPPAVAQGSGGAEQEEPTQWFGADGHPLAEQHGLPEIPLGAATPDDRALAVARLRSALDDLDARTRLPGEPPLRQAVAEQAHALESERQAASRAACLANWPEAESMGYDPRCCRFPKSCSVEEPPRETVDTQPEVLEADDTVPVEKLAHWLHGEFDTSAENSDLLPWAQEREGIKDIYRRRARALMSQLPELFR